MNLMNEDIVKRGYLHQQIAVQSCFRTKQTWQRIFLLLKDGCLFVFESPRALQPLQTYPLYASSVLFPQFPKVTRSNCLQVETPTDSLFLCADSPAEIKEWAIQIQKAAILASGGSVGKLQLAGSAASSTVNPSASSSYGSAAPGTPARFRTASAFSGYNPAPLSLPLELLGSHSPEASSLIAEASMQAAYDRVLRRFRMNDAVTSHTSNSLACLAASGAYARYRLRARHRIAAEWVASGLSHAQDNFDREHFLPESGQFDCEIDSLGTLRASLQSVTLSSQGEGQIAVSNTASYPLAVRLGQGGEAWLRSNTPLWIQPGETASVVFAMQRREKDAATAAASSLSLSASPAAASSSAAGQLPPVLPCTLLLRSRPADATDLAHSPLLLFEDEDGQPATRCGERLPIQILAGAASASLASASATAAAASASASKQNKGGWRG